MAIGCPGTAERQGAQGRVALTGFALGQIIRSRANIPAGTARSYYVEERNIIIGYRFAEGRPHVLLTALGATIGPSLSEIGHLAFRVEEMAELSAALPSKGACRSRERSGSGDEDDMRETRCC